MNAVLYTHQLEPITVVNIPMWLWDRLGMGEPIRLQVIEPMQVSLSKTNEAVPRYRVVSVVGEKICRRGHESLMLFTADEEDALLLKADFLPGQRGEINSIAHGAFASGFMRALRMAGK